MGTRLPDPDVSYVSPAPGNGIDPDVSYALGLLDLSLSAASGMPAGVTDGGTGMASLTAFAVLLGGTTATNSVQQVDSVGSAGQPLLSGGPAAKPQFGGAISPSGITLVDASTVNIDSALANYFELLMTAAVGGSRTIAAPTHPIIGRTFTIALQQPASGGPCSPSFASGAGGYSFGTDGAPTWSTAASNVDEVAFRYHAGLGKYLCQGSKLGFS